LRSKTETAETLEEAQARADALFLSIGVGAMATDERGHISKINDVALDILGYTKREVLGKWYPEVIKTVDEIGQEMPLINQPITQAFLTGSPITQKAYYKRKPGEMVPVSITVSPILMGGKPIGAVEVFYDSSHEDRVDRMKSEFISIASHQLRTPLAAINTYANLLASGYEGKLNKGQQEYLGIILSSVDRMNVLISTLLDIAKLEEGTLSVRIKKIDMEELLDGALRELRQLATEKNIKLAVDLPKKKIFIDCDPLLLGEIYRNLISNAIKYTPKGGSVKVVIRLKNNKLTFRVDDTGHGIPDNLQDQIFTKFFRASNIKRLDTSGTGLGLYMAKQIADVLGGHLEFESQEDKGSSFRFNLPLS
jgi:PAS domain S-box-containing protein